MSIKSRFTIFIGADWGSQFHQVCILTLEGILQGEKVFSHSGEGLQQLADWILDRAGCAADKIAVGIEVPHGPVVDTLLERGFHVFSINPKQADRFRDRLSPAGAKDDRRDARVIADALRTDIGCFRELNPMDPKIVQLREWSRMNQELTNQRTRLTHQIRTQFWRYFPQFLTLGFALYSPALRDLWKLILTPKRARRVHLSSVTKVLKKHRIRRLNAEQVLTHLRTQPIRVAAGVVEAATASIRIHLQQLELLERQISEAKQAMKTILDSLNDAQSPATSNYALNQEKKTSSEEKPLSDVEILLSIPGMGPTVLAALISEAYGLLSEQDYRALRCLCGVAPVTKRSGKSWKVVRRKACQARLGNAVYHWSRVAIQHDPISRAKYDALRKRGHSHGRALRSVADRLLAIACVMLRDRTLFDPSRRTAAA